jgi:hypothetical protein
MGRTSYEAVAKLVEVDATISTDLAPFIETANAMVTEHCVDAAETNNSDRLELIERYLAAHFYKIRDAMVRQESVGPITAMYEYKLDKGLHLTTWGQMATLLDSTGGLAAWNKQIVEGKAARTVGVSWLGLAPSDQTEYEGRD